MVRFRVFLGAPSAADMAMDPNGYVWRTHQEPSPMGSLRVPFPPATLDAASRRISLLYQNVIFTDSQEPEQINDDDDSADGSGSANRTMQTTFVTWPPTPAANTTGAPSFLRPSGSLLQGTYQTEETGTSFEYSDASSIARFPNFQFSLHKLTPLSSLCAAAKSGRGSRKVNMLLAALEVQGPDSVRVKKGSDAGQQVSILKLILGDDQGSVCKMTAWRDTADAWARLGPSPGLKRGDILYFESTLSFPYLMAAWEPGSTITLTASPHNRPVTEICYRTMPYTHEDNRLRPDLRLGQSDAVVGKVAALVRWFENMAGLPGA
ncbi:hypothetical protein HD554DRAFT_2205633 [Boletus coccyginus]|nr:hypothetical protein HD554DRAFT_2205633 [Boletus coccyginus]